MTPPPNPWPRRLHPLIATAVLTLALSLAGCSAIEEGAGFVTAEVRISSAAAETATALEQLPGVNSVESEYSLSELTVDVTLVLSPGASTADVGDATEAALAALQQDVFANRLPTLLVLWDGAALVAQSAREIAAWDQREVSGWVRLADAAPILVELEVSEAGVSGRTISWPADHPVAGQSLELFADSRTMSTAADLSALVVAAADAEWRVVDEAWTVPGLSNFGQIDSRVLDLIATLPAEVPLAWPSSEDLRGLGVVASPSVLSVGWYSTGPELSAAEDWGVTVDLFRAGARALPVGGELTYASATLQAVATIGECDNGVVDSAVATDDVEFVRVLAGEGIGDLTPGRCA